jgi:outer membrane receptor for ferric coprogen and ferric-rhodotorulic acid
VLNTCCQSDPAAGSGNSQSERRYQKIEITITTERQGKYLLIELMMRHRMRKLKILIAIPEVGGMFRVVMYTYFERRQNNSIELGKGRNSFTIWRTLRLTKKNVRQK